jgi:hypothetical protein
MDTVDENRQKFWTNLDTPQKAIEMSLRSLRCMQHLTDNEVKTTTDWIVSGLSNAGFHIVRTRAVAVPYGSRPSDE